MERYNLFERVGDGAFGTVWRAINKESGEVVAIKKMKKKYYSWEECNNLQEVKSLQSLHHPNIVKLLEVIREHDTLYFVFEYMDCCLYQLMTKRDKPFSEAEVRNWCFQVFQALAFMHQRGYFHRDIKPENLLVRKDTMKIADLGLARKISSEPPFTVYVSTRWYRAPEVLLQSSVYGPAVDMWAMGAVIAELLTLQPLFPGSSEPDELHKICSIIGAPDSNSWAEGLLLADALGFQFPQVANTPLSKVVPLVSKDAISLISTLCSWDPSKRPTAAEILKHPFFQPCFHIPSSYCMKTSIGVPNTPPSAVTRGALGQKTARRYSVGVLSAANPANNCSPSVVGASFKTGGVQRKLEMDHQQVEKKEKEMKNNWKPSAYQPPMKRNPGHGRDPHRVRDVVDKFAHLSVSSNRVPNAAEKLPQHRQRYEDALTIKKAGGWLKSSGEPHKIPAARAYPNEVAG